MTVDPVNSLVESRLPPIPPIRVRRFTLPEYQSDSVSILQHLDFFKRVYMRHAVVRLCTVALFDGLDNNDIRGQVQRITDFVKQKVIYVRDPEHTEFVVSPVRHLVSIREHGVTHGDCDDHVLLLNSMLGSVGISTRFVGVKLHGPKFDHVISAVKIGHDWVDIDPCAKRNPQRQFTDRLEIGPT